MSGGFEVLYVRGCWVLVVGDCRIRVRIEGREWVSKGLRGKGWGDERHRKTRSKRRGRYR